MRRPSGQQAQFGARALIGLRLAAGERVVGWKLGYTSEVMRRQMGIDRPNIGLLTDWMLLGSGDAVHERLVQLRVESEIGLRLQIALDTRQAPVDRHTVSAAVEDAYACLEVVHSTWTGYGFNLEQNTADNSSAGQVVVGPRLPVTDLMALDTVAVRLHDGSLTLDAVARLARLARELAAMDRRLEAGDLVITGGLMAACALEVGGRLAAVFSSADAWSVEVAVRRG